jgi:hypothetical protein
LIRFYGDNNMKRRMLQVVFLLTLVGSIHKSNGYGRGAPDTTCSSMMPRVSVKHINEEIVYL